MHKVNPDRTVCLIPCAVGGSPQSQGMPGGKLYEEAFARTREAMKQGQLKAILWHQGESDSGVEARALAHGDNLVKIVESFRKDLNAEKVPFIAGE